MEEMGIQFYRLEGKSMMRIGMEFYFISWIERTGGGEGC